MNLTGSARVFFGRLAGRLRHSVIDSPAPSLTETGFQISVDSEPASRRRLFSVDLSIMRAENDPSAARSLTMKATAFWIWEGI